MLLFEKIACCAPSITETTTNTQRYDPVIWMRQNKVSSLLRETDIPALTVRDFTSSSSSLESKLDKSNIWDEGFFCFSIIWFIWATSARFLDKI